MSFGKVKWYDQAQGYGFIIHTDGREVYFHYTAIADNMKEFRAGSSVVYDIIETRLGLEASNVRRASASFYL